MYQVYPRIHIRKLNHKMHAKLCPRDNKLDILYRSDCENCFPTRPSLLSVTGIGSTRYHVPGKRSKEADEGIRPRTRPAHGWPSLVFEIGYSESLPALHCDAAWWLLNSNGDTRMVVVIRAAENPPYLHLESWELVPNPIGHGRSTRTTPATVPDSPLKSPPCYQKS